MMKAKEGYISIWLGTTKKKIDEFNKYVEGLEESSPECQILKDFRVGFIDLDKFGAYLSPQNKELSIDDLGTEIGCNSKKTEKKIVDACKKMGIYTGNALYYYGDYEFIEDVSGYRYNDLFFIGTFPDPRKKLR